MAHEMYQKLFGALSKRGGLYAPRDIPEFFALAEALFSLEEAEVQCAMPPTPFTAEMIAQQMNRNEAEISRILEAMGNKGCCGSAEMGGKRWYLALSLMLLSETPFIGGSTSEWHRRLATRVHEYRKAIDDSEGMPRINFPVMRMIPVEVTIQTSSRVRNYDQMTYYLDKSDLIAVGHCYCRHAAALANEKDICNKPTEVCMTFGLWAAYIIERGMGRKISKEEAREVLKKAEDAGLVHCTRNTQDLTFVCSCCPDHCIHLKIALAQPKPGLALSSGFEAIIDATLCKGDGVCVQVCPSRARSIGENGIGSVDNDRCFGCGICVTKCPWQASRLVAKEVAAVPPMDQPALVEAIKVHSKL